MNRHRLQDWWAHASPTTTLPLLASLIVVVQPLFAAVLIIPTIGYLILVATPLRNRLPHTVLARDAHQRDNPGDLSRILRNNLRRVPGDYRQALRQVARLLYVNEGLYSSASGGGPITDEAVHQEPAPTSWGDYLYDRLGLDHETRYG